MSGAQHTKLRLAPAPIHGMYDILDDHGTVIALSAPPEHAKRIVQCWNAHDNLVRALESAEAWIRDQGGMPGRRTQYNGFADTLRAAIAKATGSAS